MALPSQHFSGQWLCTLPSHQLSWPIWGSPAARLLTCSPAHLLLTHSTDRLDLLNECFDCCYVLYYLLYGRLLYLNVYLLRTVKLNCQFLINIKYSDSDFRHSPSTRLLTCSPAARLFRHSTDRLDLLNEYFDCCYVLYYLLYCHLLYLNVYWLRTVKLNCQFWINIKYSDSDFRHLPSTRLLTCSPAAGDFTC